MLMHKPPAKKRFRTISCAILSSEIEIRAASLKYFGLADDIEGSNDIIFFDFEATISIETVSFLVLVKVLETSV